MTEENVTSLPGRISLDLDAYERPEGEIKPPFVVVIADREIKMADPADLDWRDLITLENPMEFIRLCLSAEDRRFLLEQNLPGWKFNTLMQAFYTHFDLDEKVRQARRQQQLAGA